ncbi:histidine phosphatase family protein [Lysobacter sp. CA199]|uniref:SixA phosphatase family protein n=1 Tax=Lysobacter sp. CA199 TaxID=3455608 RepID=UPI003F8D03FA
MRPLPRLAAIALCLSLAACASTPPAPTASYVVVRHAEKAADDPRDPTLTDAGRARAERLAVWLKNEPLRAVYATAYRRTQQTGEPAARAHGLNVTTYDGKRPATKFAAQLRRDHPQGVTLIVGHSNTAADIAAALCGCTVEPIPETEFDRRMRIDVGASGRAVLTQTRDR